MQFWKHNRQFFLHLCRTASHLVIDKEAQQLLLVDARLGDAASNALKERSHLDRVTRWVSHIIVCTAS